MLPYGFRNLSMNNKNKHIARPITYFHISSVIPDSPFFILVAAYRADLLSAQLSVLELKGRKGVSIGNVVVKFEEMFF